jgi:hypothetical protein
MKVCRICLETFPQQGFYRDNSRPDGLKSSCKCCDGQYYQKRRSKTKTEIEISDIDQLLRKWGKA